MMLRYDLIRNLIQAEIKKEQLSRQKIAEKLGLSSTTLFNCLNSEADIRISTLEAIAKYFDKPISYFFEEEGSFPATTPVSFDHIEAYQTYRRLIPPDREWVNKLMNILDSHEEGTKEAIRSNLREFYRLIDLLKGPSGQGEGETLGHSTGPPSKPEGKKSSGDRR